MGSQVTPAHHRAAMCGTDQGLGMGHISGTPMQALDPWKCRGAAPSCGAGRGARGLGPPDPKLLLTSTGAGVPPPDPRSLNISTARSRESIQRFSEKCHPNYSFTIPGVSWEQSSENSKDKKQAGKVKSPSSCCHLRSSSGCAPSCERAAPPGATASARGCCWMLQKPRGLLWGLGKEARIPAPALLPSPNSRDAERKTGLIPRSR